MLKRLFVLPALTLALALGATTSPVLAQCSCATAVAYAPVNPGYVTYYAPATTAYYAPATTAYVPATTAYYAPATYVADYAPAVTYASYYAPVADPYVSYYAPAATYTSYYTPYTTYYTPYTSYYAPYTAYYAPATTYVAGYGVVGPSIYGTPKVYVPGEPVRNFIRRTTP